SIVLSVSAQLFSNFETVPPFPLLLFVKPSEESAAGMEVFVENQHFLFVLQYPGGAETGRPCADDYRIKHAPHPLSPDGGVPSAVRHPYFFQQVSGTPSDSFLHLQ